MLYFVQTIRVERYLKLYGIQILPLLVLRKCPYLAQFLRYSAHLLDLVLFSLTFMRLKNYTLQQRLFDHYIFLHYLITKEVSKIEFQLHQKNSYDYSEKLKC